MEKAVPIPARPAPEGWKALHHTEGYDAAAAHPLGPTRTSAARLGRDTSSTT
ncbi:hypothetical protein E2C01_090435 [Portunus trituberculatus]|uniref:Uncharacterized protein n=1 Tax=Portunus trituberculatus TaxID=210409 RepID=A0A5B7JLD2_PORTR|nr:hypothetical protein [Portunus trituberculatus]